MPNDFDKIIRENLDALMPFIARKLLNLYLSQTETLKDKIQVTLEREGDHFKKVYTKIQRWTMGCTGSFKS